MKLYYYSKFTGYTKNDTDKLINRSLESYFGEEYSPKAFKLKRDSNGKPNIESPEKSVFVGVTHTDDLVIVALSDKDFGIDCESKTRDIKRQHDIAKKYFSDKENEYVYPSGTPLDEKSERERFLEIWVKKEAYVKFLGTGLKSMKDTDVFLLPGCFQKVNYGNNIIYIYIPE